jgi:lipopolysaccharide biosynthesis protein
MAAYLENISEEIDVFVTVAREDDAERVLAAAPANASQLFVGVVPNIGRDMAPFLAQLRVLRKLGYEMALKVHTKARSTRQDGDEWRGDMLRKLVGSAAAVDAITGWIRSDPGVGLVGPSGHLLPIEFFWGRAEEAERNLMHFRRLTAAAGLPSRSHGFVFPAGSFYWFRPRALAPLMVLGLDPLEFAAEGGQRDGTVAHALERLVGLAASTDGWRVEPTASAFAGEPSTSWIERSDEAHYPFACATEDGRAKEGPVAGIR